MKNFIDLLTPQTDKADLGEYILIKQNLPERVTERIPDCLYAQDPKYPDDEDKGVLDREVFLVMAWVLALREAPEITIEEVGQRIRITDLENFPEILKRVIYFVTTKTREEVDAMSPGKSDADEEEPEEGKSENPTQEDSTLEPE